MTLPFLLLALVACQALAAPATNSSRSQTTSPAAMPTATDSSISLYFILYSDPAVVPITSTRSIASASPSNLTGITSSRLTRSMAPSSIALVTSPSLIPSPLSPSSVLFMSLPTSTSLVTELVTATETTIVDVPPSSTSIVTVVVTATATATPSTTPFPTWDNRTLWAEPPQITDLSAFNVTYFPSGQKNLRIVAQVPAKAVAPTVNFLQDPLLSSANATTPPLAILQLVYPAHSVNPGSKPEGGADFYATPLNLAGARNVTLAYSVFFPADFDWVKGGKLPGLFGGHTGCSGGTEARDCFSTRLMWRPQGVGELYLYAPKNKQSEALCADVGSVCDVSYGFSVGRGAFTFAAGDWTHLSQNVVLNTPGRDDGGFTLSVNGRVAIHRTDVFYRDVAQPAGENMQPTGFLGLFFSTFFGGHGSRYATPRQQYAWFKGFAITRHD